MATNRISNGELGIAELKIRSTDEIGQLSGSVNSMVKQLREVILKISKASEVMAASSQELSVNMEQSVRTTEQIAHSPQRVAAGAEEQVNHMDEVTVAVHQAAAGVKRIVENRAEMTDMMETTLTLSENGSTMVNQVRGKMSDIQQAAERTKVDSQHSGRTIAGNRRHCPDHFTDFQSDQPASFECRD
ncbi:HAMP domain-containing protein [Brevibacillus sp. NRS-1366]|uniref:HAMP domain-containing protein n=1 Tax=Brevibacillus sp. NRS-1366 TaxID=3233899 RepID=UPI003D24B5DA